MTPAFFSLRRFADSWNDFWHAPCDVRVCAVIRILWGMCVLLSFVGAYPSVELWWSEAGFLPLTASEHFVGQSSYHIYDVLRTRPAGASV